MDATELIEEAEMLSAVASAAPWRCEHGRGRFEIKSGAVSLVGVLYEQDRDFIVGARTMVPELAAALRASEERARKAEDERDEIAAGLRSSSNLNFAMRQERDALAAANLAANKRIVELEQERDAAKRQISALENQLVNAAALRIEDEAHCERLIAERDAARAELARLTTPRPIAEAPTDKPVLGIWIDHRGNKCVEVLRWGGRWMGALGTPLYREAEYLPMPEVKP